MSKIKILAVAPDSHGVGKYRVIDPYTYIGDNYSDEIHVDLTFDAPNDDEYFKDYNVVVFHTFIHPTNHEDNLNRIKWLKNKGIKVIMDIDDLWFVDQRHPAFHQIRIGKVGEKKIEFLKLADVITTTTPIFAKTITDKLGLKNIQIFPNAVDPNEPQFQHNPTPSDKVRFGWLGGSSHLHDIELLTNGISSLHYSHKDKVQFVLCGFDLRGKVKEINNETKEVKERDILPEETVWYRYEEIFTDKYRVLDDEYVKYLKKYNRFSYPDTDKPYVRRWTEDIKTYANNYNHFDVSLAPIVDSFFNSNKSQLKIIEAGFHKKAIIASDLPPYTLDLVSAFDNGKLNDTGNALLVSSSKNHKQWAQHMKKLADNPELVKELGERLYQTVKDKYSLPVVCKNRVEFIKSIL